MALSASSLSSELRAAFLADSNVGAVDGPALTALCDALATAVVDHLTTNGVILPGTFSNSGGPVVGTGLIQ